MYSYNLKAILMYLRGVNIKKQCFGKLQYTTLARKTAPIKTELSTKENFELGKVYHGFKAVDLQSITEYSIEAIRFEHEETNAEYLHLHRDDSNNVFSINFRTTPRDSTGKPHILEHTVLCGSEMYPVRDPFFKMLNRSLATFMNALTGPDYTMYPFSTTNEKDFRNLQSVYLDAVFKPKLLKTDFMQEGWRLENIDLNNPHSEITIRGVVYNEMKGALSENERILGEKLMNEILPDHTYGVISGGDPLQIPKLTWEELKLFHRVHYHPSNAKFYSYGNFPLLPTLKYINEQYLQHYKKIDVKHTQVPSQRRWNKPHVVEIFGRFNEMATEKQNSILVAYLMNDIQDVYSTLVMHFITELLTKTSNAPFYKSLIETNFSGGYSTCTGFEHQIKDTMFALGLQSIDEKDFDKFLKIYEETLDQVIKNGFTSEQIETVLHGYELGLKHESSNFGLHLLFGVAPLLNHNVDVIKSLKVNELINKLKDDLKNDPQFLQKTINARFKNNTHKLIIKMRPDKDYDKKLLTQEQKIIEEKVSVLDDIQKKDIFLLGRQLQEEQKKIQHKELLPTLKQDDIVKVPPPTNAAHTTIENVPVQICEAPTNGITYLKMMFDVTHLTDYDHKMLIPLFNYVVSKLGTPKYNFRDFDSLVNRKTSGLSFSTHISENLKNIDEFQQSVALNSYCLDNNLESMIDIWKEVFHIEKLDDVKRFELLTNLYVTNLTHGIVDSGHLYAMSSASSLVSGSAYQQEVLGGLSHIKYMKLLMKNCSYVEILQKIEHMAKLIFNKKYLRIAVNCLPQNSKQVLNRVESLVKDISGENNSQMNVPNFVNLKVFDGLHMTECKHHVLNIPVYFGAKTIKTVPYLDDKFAHLRILARYLTAKYLYPVIREANGAYGSGAKLSTNGLFTYFSYRDPNNVQTLEVFDKTHDYLRSKFDQITDEDVFEAKLNIFQSIDAPVSPSAKGNTLFYNNLTDEMFQEHRLKLLNVTKKDFLNASEEFLSENTKCRVGKVILGPEIQNFDTLVKENEHWTTEKTETFK